MRVAIILLVAVPLLAVFAAGQTDWLEPDTEGSTQDEGIPASADSHNAERGGDYSSEDESDIYVIAVQHAVVFILVALSFHAARVFNSVAFRYVCAGWAFNFVYLLCCYLGRTHSMGWYCVLSEPYMEDLSTLTSSMLFWIGARRHKEISGFPLFRKASDSLVILFIAVAFAWSLLARIKISHSENSYVFFILRVGPMVAVEMLALSALALFMTSLFREYVQMRRRGRFFVAAGCWMYVAIQPLYIFTFEGLPEDMLRLGDSGFYLGVIAKALIAFGLSQLLIDFVEAFVRTSERTHIAEEKEKALAEVAHELGTPITRLRVILSTLLEEAPSRGQFTRDLAALMGSVVQIDAIIDASKEILALDQSWKDVIHAGSAIDTGNLLNTERVCRVNTLLEIAVMAVRQTRAEQADIRANYSGNCCIRCIPIEVIQIFVNILRNAYDAFTSDCGTIEISTINERNNQQSGDASSHGFVRVVFKDRGEGVPKASKDRIFEVGFTTRAGLGRGYGLGVVKDLLDKNSGRIDIVSPAYGGDDNGIGTEVTIRFRRVSCKEVTKT